MAPFRWSYSFGVKKLNVKKNVNLNFTFANTANVKLANGKPRFAVWRK
jgi:hypothetical protein